MSGDRVLIFDTTLRDGEQCPGASMNAGEKIAIAVALEALGVDIIEAGFPASSGGDFGAVQAVASRVKESIVCALARARIGDVEAAAAALEPAQRKRIHTFISTSALHMKYKLQMEPEQVLEAIDATVKRARELCDDVEWSCEDGTRSDYDFLRRCFESAIKAGATTVNIADTVGFILPEEFYQLVTNLRSTVPGMENVRFSVHCHDDLGLATANSLAAIKAGARQAECTINGIGERAGNASLEEVVMAIYTRRSELGVHTNVRTEQLTRVSQMVSGVTGFTVPPNKAVVGGNAFAHESGIHQHGVLMNRGTYEIISPEKVGADGSRLVMGKHSGRHALRSRLQALGMGVSEDQLQEIFINFKRLADERKVLDDEDILGLVDHHLGRKRRRPHVERVTVEVHDDGGKAHASVTVSNGGPAKEATGEGAGALEAIGAALRRAIPHHHHTVGSTAIHATSGASAAPVKATVRLDSVSGQHFVGHGSSLDPNLAYARAYLAALSPALAAAENDPEILAVRENA
jgi:2-isopropylmalate synthase